jgi:pimeloyl-ACP methyl ester carboxylesterase
MDGLLGDHEPRDAYRAAGQQEGTRMMSATPDREGELRLPDGRRVTFAEFGAPDGRPVLLLHGNPGSRLACPDLPTTRDLGVRLVTVDRPGFGGSDPAAMHRLTDVADDLAQLVDHLDLGPLPVLGWSGGGPYALAFAATHPALVPHAVSLSGSGLVDDPDLLAERTAEADHLVTRLRNGDATALREVEDRFAAYAEDPRLILEMTLANEDDPDRPLMADPEVAAALTTMWEEGARQGAAGVAAGWAALWALPRGYEPTDVHVPVTVWHGEADVVVPCAQARRVAEAIPHATLHTFPGEGHLVALEHWRDILEDAVAPDGSPSAAGPNPPRPEADR